MTNPLTRRNFLRALAASAIAAGCPLPAQAETVLWPQEVIHDETTDARLSRLKIKRGAPYKVAYCIRVDDFIQKGEIWQIYAEAHGNPRQRKQIELAWVTWVRIKATCGQNSEFFATVARARGNDLRKNRKTSDTRVGTWIPMQDYPFGIAIQYVMRAVNLKSRGHFRLSRGQGKLGYVRFR